ncbi:MAG: hypothetical protein A3F09_03545 [Chlamydiae bacterium RIFCSPHIGHO2_12_FULL_49_11]|nr:MAG: hypothetical protein A3F09_03545 [Chlamydiae bacterium RIFCSPHIGHO2_12_FULL_49_11]
MKDKVAQSGNKIKVHYVGKLKDGTQFDSSYDRNEPLEFTIGTEELIPGFENACIGMHIGEKKEIELSASEAYGEHSPSLVRKVERHFFPSHIEPELGMQLQLGQNEEAAFVRVVNLDESHVELDANHPLAGKSLFFSIELVAVI